MLKDTIGNNTISYDIDENLPNEVFDERGNICLAMRHVSWNGKDHKLELRKWMTNKDGQEIPNKGFSFLTEDGPNNLVNALVRNGYGRTIEVMKELKTREDFMSALGGVLNKEEGKSVGLDESDIAYYDPRETDDFLY